MDKIINLLINNWTKGVDTYTHNGSTWLIFTEQKSWVIELTENKTLWYNYNFFKELFSLTSMDVVDNQHYITKWVEDNIINGVRHTDWGPEMNDLFVDDALENGIKETESWNESIIGELNQNGLIDIVIMDGIKETKYNQSFQEPKFKKVLKNGIIMSNPRQYVTNKIIDDTIETGVKKTQGTPNWTHDQKVSNVIDNGVKETKGDSSQNPIGKVGKVIDNGVKETHGDVYHNIGRINGVIKNGVKETRVCDYKDPNTNLLYIKWDVEINRVIKNGTKIPPFKEGS